MGDVFTINSTGFILVAKKLDRETENAYELTIVAQDRAGTLVKGFLLRILINNVPVLLMNET